MQQRGRAPIMRDYYVVPNIGVRAPATLYYVQVHAPLNLSWAAGRRPKRASARTTEDCFNKKRPSAGLKGP